MGKHSRPDDPNLTRPDALPSGVAPEPDLSGLYSAWLDVADDWADDGRVSSASRDRLVRALRTAAQGAVAAVVVAVVPAVWDVLNGATNVDSGDLVTAATTAALAALVAYVSPKRRK